MFQNINRNERKNVREKVSFMTHKKTFNAIFKIGFNPVLGSILRLPPKLVLV